MKIINHIKQCIKVRTPKLLTEASAKGSSRKIIIRSTLLKAKKLANFRLTCKMPFLFQPSKLARQQNTTEFTVGSNWAQCLRQCQILVNWDSLSQLFIGTLERQTLLNTQNCIFVAMQSFGCNCLLQFLSLGIIQF